MTFARGLLKHGVLSRFTAFVAVDRAEMVNLGGVGHQVVQAVELPAGWEMPKSTPALIPLLKSLGGVESYMLYSNVRCHMPLIFDAKLPERPWPDRLEALLNDPITLTTVLIVEIRNGLLELKKLGEATTALITEGEKLISMLESDSDTARIRLVNWLYRVRKQLKRLTTKRWFWWR